MNDYYTITPITDQIYLSGIKPLNNSLNKNFSHILCCTPRDSTKGVHDKFFQSNPDLTVMYLPLWDNLQQNLWESNNNRVQLMKNIRSSREKAQIINQMDQISQSPIIEIGYNFIKNAVDQGGSILIHCMAGMSRSVSLLTFFFMNYYGMSLEQALCYIKNKRPIANPNDSFIKQLRSSQG